MRRSTIRGFIRSFGLIFSAALAIACGRGKGASSPTGMEPALVANDDAAIEIAIARCERERICRRDREDVAGVDDRTTAACVRSRGGTTQDDFAVASCPLGIRRMELDACLQAIEAEKCGNPLDSLARITACRTSALCVRG